MASKSPVCEAVTESQQTLHKIYLQVILSLPRARSIDSYVVFILCKYAIIHLRYVYSTYVNRNGYALLVFHHFRLEIHHYENTPFQIYWKYCNQKGKFSDKKSDIFHISAQNIDCGYSLEPPRRGGSNEYPQSMLFSKIRKIIYTPVNPSFTIQSGVWGRQNYTGVFSWCILWRPVYFSAYQTPTEKESVLSFGNRPIFRRETDNFDSCLPWKCSWYLRWGE